MTNPRALLINPDANFDEQMKAVRGLLSLSSDGVNEMSNGCLAPDSIDAIFNINQALAHWIDFNLTAELRARGPRPRPRPVLAAGG